MTDTITIDLGIKEKKMTNKQIKDLESLFNYYSFQRSYYSYHGKNSDNNSVFCQMIALKDVLKILGFKIEKEKKRVYAEIEYDCYKLVKK